MAYNYNQNNVSNDKNQKLKGEIKDLVKREFEFSIKRVCSETEMKNVPTMSEVYSEYISSKIIEKVENPVRDKKLEILYNHEKHFLEILKDYKEEIKFASSLQAEIRKEQATFFSSTLKEVCNSLKETQVKEDCQVQWIYDMVTSYTSSLKISSKLAEEHVIQLLGDIQKEVSETVNKD